MARLWLTAIALLLATLAGAARDASAADPSRPVTAATFDQEVEHFLHQFLALHPSRASAAGYHLHRDERTRRMRELDGELDDVSVPAYEQARHFLHVWQARFDAVAASTLDPEQSADLALLRDAIALELLAIETIQDWRHEPNRMLEMLGSALLAPIDSDHAPRARRVDLTLDRLAQVPRFLAQVRSVTLEVDPVHLAAALEEARGVRAAIDDTLRHEAADWPERTRRHARLADAADGALAGFSAWLRDDVARRPMRTRWRLGAARYQSLFQLTMHADIQPDQLLQQSRAEMRAVRENMLALAAPIHLAQYPGHDHAAMSARDREQTILQEVMAQLGEDHVLPAQLKTTIEEDLAEIHAFLRSHALLTVDTGEQLQVIDTPEFMRASYSVAGFQAPPPLDPQARAQFWVTPIAADASAAEVDARLREYDRRTLKWLAIHEAMPGHYVQFQHANQLKPPARRVLRAVFGNGAYVEGWAEYIAGVLQDAGFQQGDPAWRLIMGKIRLRVLANAVLDISLHTAGMSDEDALTLLQQDALQTTAEAAGKLRRAKLSAVQLSTYAVGLAGWRELRRVAQDAAGSSFDLRTWHDRALAEGALPLGILRALLLAAPDASATPPPASAPD